MTHYPGNSSVRSAESVANNLERFAADDPDYRLVEVDMDPEVYDDWHIPGAVHIDWEADINSGLGGKILDADELEPLLGELGITNETTVVLYGDKANWFAAHAYWALKYYGHEDVQLLDGGRRYWKMHDFETSTDTEPTYPTQEYTVSGTNDSIRALKPEVEDAIESDTSLIDVRNPQEFRGEKPPAEIPNTTDREGHIPSAKNIPWGEAVDMDGRFKHPQELKEVYSEFLGDGESISYCRIGERASITWFALSELLGVDAANYDGSFTEWEADNDAPVATLGGDRQ